MVSLIIVLLASPAKCVTAIKPANIAEIAATTAVPLARVDSSIEPRSAIAPVRTIMAVDIISSDAPAFTALSPASEVTAMSMVNISPIPMIEDIAREITPSSIFPMILITCVMISIAPEIRIRAAPPLTEFAPARELAAIRAVIIPKRTIIFGRLATIPEASKLARLLITSKNA